MSALIRIVILLLVSAVLALAAGGITTPVICSGGPASCVYTIQSTSNLFLVCALNAAGGNEAVSTPTDTKSNTFTVVGNTATTTISSGCWTAVPNATGSDTVTCDSQFGDVTYCAVFELSGVLTTSMLDTQSYATGASGTMASGSFTTVATDVLIGFAIDSGAGTPTAGSGWTKTSPASCSCNADTRLILEYQLDKAAGSYNATTTATASTWGMRGFGIKEPGGGGATPVPSKIKKLKKLDMAE